MIFIKEDIDEYRFLENYIKNIFLEVLLERSMKKEDWEIPFFNTYYEDGTPFMDGNPIFSAKNLETGNIIKVVADKNCGGIIEFEDRFDNRKMNVIVFPISNIDFLKEALYKHVKG